MITSIIVLAAGRSVRMGVQKLSLNYRGKPLLQCTLERVLAANADEVLAVIPTGDQALLSIAADFPIRPVQVPPGGVMAASIVAGTCAARPDAGAIMIALGDMPDVKTATFRTLLNLATPEGIVVPTYKGQFGNPVVFGEAFRVSLTALTGEGGGRSVYEKHRDRVSFVAVDDPGILRDIDRPEDLE